MSSVESRLSSAESTIVALEKQHAFFQDTVIAHIKDEGEGNRRIFDEINSTRKNVAKAVAKISDDMKSCKETIEEDIDKFYARREHAITPTSMRNWMLFGIIVISAVISITIFIATGHAGQ